MLGFFATIMLALNVTRRFYVRPLSSAFANAMEHTRGNEDSSKQALQPFFQCASPVPY
jgi:hypothetical protein